MTLPERLKHLRGDRSVSDIAEAAGVTPGFIHQLERGDRGDRLSAAVAVRLARALGVSVEELVAPDDIAPDSETSDERGAA